MSNRNAAACAAIVCGRGKVLARRNTTEPNSGMWEFPGGMLEPGEDSLAACRRMIADQLGCRLSTVWMLDTIECDACDRALAIDCFVCTPVPGAEPTPEGNDTLRWLGLNELLDLEWDATGRQIVGLVGTYWDQLMLSEHL